MATYLEELIGLKRNPNAFTVLPIERTETGYSFPAMPTLAYDAIDAIINAATLPRDVYRGDRQPTVEDATNFALTFMGAGAPVTRPANSLGVGFTRTGEVVDELPLKAVGRLNKAKYKPISEMEVTIDPRAPYSEFNPITPEDLYGSGNNVVLSLLGDASNAAGSIRSIAGNQLERPVELKGGYGYAQLSPNQVWASDRGVTTKLQNAVNRLSDEYENVIGGYMSMGGQAVDASHMMSDAYSELVKASKISNKAASKINDEMKDALPDFVGIKSEKLGEYLRGLTMGERKKFFDIASKATHKNAGMPDVAEVRFAVTDPALVHTSPYSMGPMFSRMTPNAPTMKAPDFVHESYPTAMQGQYIGGFEDLVPIQTMMPDFVKRMDVGDVVLPSQSRAIQMGAVYQPLNQQWLDETMKFLETIKQMGQ